MVGAVHNEGDESRDVSMTRRHDRLRDAAPAASVGALIALGVAWVLPGGERQPLVETLVWSLVLVAAFAGWGSLVRFLVARQERVDIGLRVAWGAGATAFVCAVLAVPSLMTRIAALFVVEVGVVLALIALAWERLAVSRAATFAWRVARMRPAVGIIGGFIVVLVALHYLAGISEWHTNPYDDDIAYLTFVKKLLDAGSFPEPFSFRRLSALGGQTVFHALVALRAAPSQAHTFDRSMCLVLLPLLVVGHRTRGRRPSVLVGAATIACVLWLPLTAINTASHFSGLAFFVAFVRTLAWTDERRRPFAPWQNAVPLALVGATVCTLRQNFLPLPIVILAVSYGVRALRSREPFRRRIAEPAWVAGLTALALLPWLVAAWQSNRTFLYPVMPGTFNPALALTSDSVTFGREVQLNLRTLLEGVPLATSPLFALAAVFVRRETPSRPLLSFGIATAIGLVMLVHGLTQGDPGNLGRYVYGYVVAFAVVVALVAGAVGPAPRGNARTAYALVLVALIGQLVKSGEPALSFYARAFRNIDALAHARPRNTGSLPPELGIYTRLQETTPPGARVAYLLDEPYWFDFARNPMWNLDMPGYSSPAPGMPYFQGSERVEGYLRALGVRYLAFVRPTHSLYHYRREYWIKMNLDEMEIWRAFAPYLLDFVDNLGAIGARHKHLFDERGILMVDLEAPP
jgi:hypothetical protein